MELIAPFVVFLTGFCAGAFTVAFCRDCRDGIPDEDLPLESDWLYLTPAERLGVQSQADAEIARELIRKRKAH